MPVFSPLVLSNFTVHEPLEEAGLLGAPSGSLKRHFFRRFPLRRQAENVLMDIERLRTSMTRFITKKMRVTGRWTARLSAGDSPLKLVGSKCPNGLVAKAKLPKPIAIMATDHVIASRGS